MRLAFAPEKGTTKTIEKNKKIIDTLAGKLLQSRPDSGLDCLMCADFDRRRLARGKGPGEIEGSWAEAGGGSGWHKQLLLSECGTHKTVRAIF